MADTNPISLTNIKIKLLLKYLIEYNKFQNVLKMESNLKSPMNILLGAIITVYLESVERIIAIN